VILRRGRILAATAAFGGGLSVAVMPSLGASHAVTADGLEFKPATVTVTQGDSVTWTNAGGFHNVKFDDGSFDEPPDPANTWGPNPSRKFDQVGTFRYYCEAHGNPGGSGMAGTVVVTSSSTTSPTTPTQPGGGPVGGSTDKVAPKLTLGGAAAQRVVRRRSLLITVSVNERATVSGRAKVSVPGASRVLSFRKATKTVAAGAKAKLKLKLSRKGRRAVAAALARKRRLKASVTVTATDAAGNSSSAKRRIRLK
jgi:plastocyanin